VLTEIVKAQKDPASTLTKDLKYTPLINLQGDESMVTAMKVMKRNGYSRAAVVKNGQLIGMLTEAATKKLL